MDFPKQELEFFDPAGLPWQEVPGFAGLEQKVLAGDPAGADLSRLVRVAAGSDHEGTLVHDFWEEIWVVQGRFQDKRTGEVYGAGMFACHPPGMAHGPFRYLEDCVLFEVRYTNPHRT